MDAFEKPTEPPGRRKRRIAKKGKWPRWLRTGRVVRWALILGPRIYRLGEAIYSFLSGPGV